MGLASDNLLMFEEQENDNLKLEFWEPIENLAEVKATMGRAKYSLEMQVPELGIVYLGGNSKDIDEILGVLNPIQMIERKMKTRQKVEGSLSYDETIQMYSTLIEHYSLLDKPKMERHIVEMQNLIREHFEDESHKEQEMMKIEN